MVLGRQFRSFNHVESGLCGPVSISDRSRMSVVIEGGAPDVAGPQVGVVQGRKEKRKALKRLKRKEIRRELAIKEREEEQALANDPEEQLRIRLREQEEQEAAERERKAFEERERFWLQALETRRAEQEEEARRKRLLEDESREDEVITPLLHIFQEIKC